MFAYLRDALLLPKHRSYGPGLALCRPTLEHPDLTALTNWLLRSSDSTSFYARLCFTPVGSAGGDIGRQMAAVHGPDQGLETHGDDAAGGPSAMSCCIGVDVDGSCTDVAVRNRRSDELRTLLVFSRP